MAARDDVDWRTWHDNYDDPDSSLARRLTIVQDALRVALDTAPAGPITLISLCAGQARDVLGVVPGHARRADVRGRLVELDPENAATARAGWAGRDRGGPGRRRAHAGSQRHRRQPPVRRPAA